MTVSYNVDSSMNIADQTSAFNNGYLRMTTAYSAIGETATQQTFGGHKPKVQVIDNNFIKTDCVACSVIKYALSSSIGSVVSLSSALQAKITLNAQNNIEILTDAALASEDIYIVATYDAGLCATLFNEPSNLMKYKTKFFKITVEIVDPCAGATIAYNTAITDGKMEINLGSSSTAFDYILKRT